MKTKIEFKPVVITLETQTEVDAMRHALGVGYRGEHFKDERIRMYNQFIEEVYRPSVANEFLEKIPVAYEKEKEN